MSTPTLRPPAPGGPASGNPAPRPPAPGGPALRGPVLVTVRLHRLTLWALPALLVLAAAFMFYQWRHTTTVAADFAGTGCSVERATQACGDTVRYFVDSLSDLRRYLEYAGLALLVLPGLVGAFVAGPVIARELESGTYKLAWTQSVSPARWLAARLAVPTLWAVVLLSVAVVLFHWAQATVPAGLYPLNWYDRLGFTGLGPLPVAYALFGIAVGALIGLLARRTVVAMSLALLAVGSALALLDQYLRSRLWPTVTVEGKQQYFEENAWVVQQGAVTPSGRRASYNECIPIDPSPCADSGGGLTHFVDYHPAAHFWPLQLVETGIVLALAAVAAFAAFRIVRRLG
ncbi:hypothetical protein ACWEJP_22390 [Streptomyces sp. NPDC004749]